MKTINSDNTIKTNNLKHKITCKDAEWNNMFIDIRLNDECHKGHQDFAITANIYEKGKPHTDRYCIAGGCCHEGIIAARPDLQIFVDLHLSDASGVPMYAVENGFYHLENGFNSGSKGDQFKSEFCQYYRMTPSQFEVIKNSANKMQYALNLQSLGILAQWEKQAQKAIQKLEKLTGKKFVNDNQKSQYHAPTPDEINQEKTKQAEGYYTPEAEAAREAEKAVILSNKLEKERREKLESIHLEYDTKQAVFLVGGEKALNNCIYYNHTKQVCFNWKSYDMISTELYNQVVNSIVLPEGISIRNDNGRN